MWTAHVVRDGVAALDPLDGVQQPREAGPVPKGGRFTKSAPPDAPGPAVGHGTQALQEMAAARPPTPRSPSSAERKDDRQISTLGAIGVFAGALLLFAVGFYFFRQGAFTVEPAPSVSRTATVDQPDYRVSVPNAWPQRTTSGTLFDAVYSVPDREILNVGVLDLADAALSDPAARDQHLALASDTVAGAIGANPVLVERTIVKVGLTTLRVTTYDLTDASGIVTRVRNYVAVGLDRAVIVTAYGTPGAIDRHVDSVVEAAQTAKIKR